MKKEKYRIEIQTLETSGNEQFPPQTSSKVVSCYITEEQKKKIEAILEP